MFITIKRSSLFTAEFYFRAKKVLYHRPQIEIMEVFATAGKITNEVALKKTYLVDDGDTE